MAIALRPFLKLLAADDHVYTISALAGAMAGLRRRCSPGHVRFLGNIEVMQAELAKLNAELSDSN